MLIEPWTMEEKRTSLLQWNIMCTAAIAIWKYRMYMCFTLLCDSTTRPSCHFLALSLLIFPKPTSLADLSRGNIHGNTDVMMLSSKITPLHCVVIVFYISRLARYDSTFFNQHLSTSFRGFIGQQVRLDFAWLCLERPFAHHAFPQGIYQQWRSFSAWVEWETFARFHWKNIEVHRILIGWCFP